MSWRANGYGSGGNPATQMVHILNQYPGTQYLSTDHTFVIWFRRSGNSQNSSGGVLFDMEESGKRHYVWVADSDHATLPNQIRWYYSDGANNRDIYWTGPVVTGNWYCVVLVRSGNTQSMYINGTLAGTADMTGVTVTDIADNMILMAGYNGSGFNGRLAELFRFDRALTSQEIADVSDGLRAPNLYESVDLLSLYIPMDSTEYVDYFRRLYFGDGILNVLTEADELEHPALRDIRPKVLTYYEESTHKKVQFTGSAMLDVTRETPYGIHRPQLDSIANAVNWCLKYQREPDPDARVPAGGPVGCFVPFIPACGYDDYWLSDDHWFNPNRWGNALLGHRTHGAPNEAYGPNSAGATRIRFNLTNKSIPCIINQGTGFTLENMAIMANSTEQIGMINHKLSGSRGATLTTRTNDTDGVITLDSTTSFYENGEKCQIRWSGGARVGVVMDSISGNQVITFSGGEGDPLPAQATAVTFHDWCYVPTNSEGYGTSEGSTQPVTRLMATNTIWDGFSVAGIQNGGYANVSNCDHHTLWETHFNYCDSGWLNYNDQGVNLEFHITTFRGANTKLFNFQAGGFMVARHVLSAYANSKLLNIGLGGANKVGPGKNNGYFKLTDVKTDTEATTGAWIIYMEGESGNELNRWCQIIIDGGANSRRANTGQTTEALNKFAKVVGRCQVTLRNVDFPGVFEIYGGSPGGSYASSEFSPGILLDRCQLLDGDAADISRLKSGDAPNYFDLRGCYANTGSTAAIDRPYRVDDVPALPRWRIPGPHSGVSIP